MSLLFITLSRFVIAILPSSKHLLILCLQSPYALMLEHKKMKSDTVSTFFPPISHEVIELDAMIFVFRVLSFKPTFSTLFHPFTLIKRLFGSSSLSAIKVVSFAYLMLIFLPAILRPACELSSPAFWFLILFSNKRNQGFLEKWFLPELNQEIHILGAWSFFQCQK